MRVAVVGLGAMGSAIAFHLADRGVDVIGLDHGRPPHPAGSSHGESRIIREAYFEHPHYVPLVRRAGELWRELERESGVPLLRRQGVLMIGPGGGSLLEGSALSARLHGIPHTRLSNRQMQARFPYLTLRGDSEGLWEPGGGILHPELCIEAHLRGARERGAELWMECGMTGWETREEGLEVQAEGGTFAVDAMVLCAGAWLPELLPSLPLQVERQVMLWFRTGGADPYRYPPDGPAFLWEQPGGELYYGIPGPGKAVKVARHHGGEVGSRGALDSTVRPGDVQPVQAFVAAHLPGVEAEPLRGAVCRYTNTPTGDFLIAPALQDPRIHVVSACSGHGFKFAGAIGEVMARRLTGEPDDFDLTPFGYGAALARPEPDA